MKERRDRENNNNNAMKSKEKETNTVRAKENIRESEIQGKLRHWSIKKQIMKKKKQQKIQKSE